MNAATKVTDQLRNFHLPLKIQLIINYLVNLQASNPIGFFSKNKYQTKQYLE